MLILAKDKMGQPDTWAVFITVDSFTEITRDPTGISNLDQGYKIR